MKLLIGLTYYYPNLSGLTKYAEFLAKNLVKTNIEVRVLCSKHEKKLKLKEVIRGVKVSRIKGLKLGKGIIMPTYPFCALIEVKKSDVINCHLPSLESFWLAFWSKIFNKKLVVTYHCYFGDSFIEKLFINTVHNLVCFWADVIIVTTKDYIVGNKLLKSFRKKLVEIYPPIEIKTANNEEKQEIAEKVDFKKNKKIVGFLGRISREKNIETLVNAIPYLIKKGVDFVIVLAGPDNVAGEERYRLKIDRLIAKHKDRVVKIGKIKNPAAFLAKCDCLVLPSIDRLEAFGMVQVEAMKCGVPCITSNLPGIRVPIQLTGIGELFMPGNSKSLAEKIVLVLKNKEKYMEGKNKVEEFFSTDKFLSDYEKLI